MKTPKARLKREKIITAAARVFNRNGYAAVTMAEVASEAETFAGSLYYYFASKDDLVEEVLNLGIAQLAETVTATIAELPDDLRPIERLRAAIKAHFFAAIEHDELVMAYWKIADQVPDAIRERQLERQKAYGRFWRDLILSAQKEGTVRSDIDARYISLILIGGRLFSLTWFKQPNDPDTEDMAEIYVSLTLDGIAAGPRTKPEPRKLKRPSRAKGKQKAPKTKSASPAAA
ncbi:MAG TPA: TetR/AcrR family transcriptional regulator [Sphingobium sp.]|nr:TetR/AcrR family transcriptional regulator [Sphingobium sp.]